MDVLKQYRDVELAGESDAVARVVDQIANNPPAGWTRNQEAEQFVNGLPGQYMYCFTSPATPQHPACNIFLAARPDGARYVSNIGAAAPTDLNRLTADMYNAAAEDFARQVVEPVLQGSGVQVELGKTETDLEDYMSPDTAAKLRAFSHTANRGTRAAHPRDQERWQAFIIAAHQGRSALHAHDLTRWLIADGWDDESAYDLGIEYEQARALLLRYDRA